MDTGIVYCDDNLQRLAALPRESVDLIYLDPPFFSNRHYEVIWGDEAEVRSFEDRWDGGIYHYVGWMKERVIEMRRVLKPTGSFFLHCDWHASHYLKVMLDEVFGDERFRNEIVWSYRRWTASKHALPRMHDVILFYTNSNTYTFQGPTVLNATPNPSQYVSAKDSHGKTVTAKDEHGRPIKRTVAERIQLGDVWDIPLMSPVSRERLGYPTQKPERLMEMLLQMSSAPGDVVLDPFAGCGTTLVAAHRLKRKWVGIDISPTACNLMKRRLQKVGALSVRLVGMPATIEDLRALKPFEFQNWIIDRINGIQAPRKSGDMGIDGRTFFLHDPVQIKQSDGVGRNVIDNFETAIQRDGKKRGFVVAFSFGKGAVEEVARVKRAGLDIQLVTVSDLLDRLDEVFVRMGTTTPTGALPGLEATPMPRIDSKRRSADELLRSAKGTA